MRLISRDSTKAWKRGAELTRRLGVVRTVYSEHGVAVFLILYMAGQRALKAPEVAELDVLVYDAVGVVLPGQPVGSFAALLYLLIRHEARAFACDEIVAADLPEGGLLVIELYDLAAREHTEAETVEAYERAGLLEHAGEVRVVDLAAHDATRQRYQGLGSGLRFLISARVSCK